LISVLEINVTSVCVAVIERNDVYLKDDAGTGGEGTIGGIGTTTGGTGLPGGLGSGRYADGRATLGEHATDVLVDGILDDVAGGIGLAEHRGRTGDEALEVTR